MVNDYNLNISGWHRQQWVGFEGRPIVGLANASFLVEKIHSAFGVSYLYDKLGAQVNQSALINYAYNLHIGEHQLIPAIQLGILFNQLDGSQLDPIQANDPNLITSSRSGMNFDLGLGLAYRYRGIAIGFSARHVTSPQIKFKDENATSTFTYARHYYGYASYEAKIGKIWRLKPIALFKTDASSYQFDQFLWFGTRNLNKFFDGVSVGGGYRFDNAAMVGIEFNLKWFTLAYTYDILTNKLKNYSTGSHEAYLRIHLFQSRKPIDQI